MKKIFPWKLNLEYGGTFTKLFMHVSSRNMFPTTRNLQIVCMFFVLAIVVETEASVHIIFFWWRTGPYTATWPSVPWTICYVVHTEYIYFFISSTEHCAWAIISPKEFKSCVTRISFALLNYLLSNILRFALKICFWADF